MTGRHLLLPMLITPWLLACHKESAPEGHARSATTGAALPRHLVIVTLDTVRADRVGVYGGPSGLTPRLDALAAEGTRFARVSAPMPLTGPSHATLFSGRYPLSHGLVDNFKSLDDSVDTLAELLVRQGFETGAFFHDFPFSSANLTQGFVKKAFDQDRRARYVNESFAGWLRSFAKPGNQTTRGDGEDLAPLARRDGASRSSPAEQGEKRLFAWIHFYVAHTPLDPPEEHRSRWVSTACDLPPGDPQDLHKRIMQGLMPAPAGYADHFRESYDAEVAYADQKLGEVLDLLSEHGLQSETLLVVASDHGESLGDDTLGMHQFVLTQETLEVPLFLRGPGVPAGKTVPRLVELVDVFPTVLELLGLVPPASQGQSLRPLLEDPEATWEDVAFAAVPVQAAGATRDAKPEQLVLWTPRWKLILEVQSGRARLFDLAADPGEERDLATERPEVVQSLGEKLRHWKREAERSAAPAGELPAASRALLESLGYF